MPKNVLYAQSGGVTAVINASASGLIAKAREYSEHIGVIYAAHNGILGVLNEELIDTSNITAATLAALAHTPGGAFGSCRYKLGSLDDNRAEYEQLIAVFKAHDIGYFFYNGGGDSQDTSHKIATISKQLDYDLQCIGIPKTIDNDLPFTDNCPGFGSVAKYVAVSIKEAALDIASMAHSSTKVFILEVMGRHAGWIAASAGLSAPHIILFPEIVFDAAIFNARVQQCVAQHGYCTVVVSEGVKDGSGRFLAESGGKDSFGHSQLGGVAACIAAMVTAKLDLKTHWAVADYLQRSARHIASQVDVDQAYALGAAAVDLAIQGKNAVMPTIVRESNLPYQWSIGMADLAMVANQEKFMPRDFISSDGFAITAKCHAYLLPLIQGEAYPPYIDGLPHYVELQHKMVPKLLK